MSESVRVRHAPGDIGGLRQVAEPKGVAGRVDDRLRSGQRRSRSQPVLQPRLVAQVDGNDQARPFSAGPDDHGPRVVTGRAVARIHRERA